MRASRGSKLEGRAVIGDGAPFPAQRIGLSLQGWIPTTALSKLRRSSSLGLTRMREKSCTGLLWHRLTSLRKKSHPVIPKGGVCPRNLLFLGSRAEKQIPRFARDDK